jgi:hypothetical protein
MAAWDGKGRPPSKAVAVDYLVKMGVPRQDADLIAKELSLDALGDRVRLIEREMRPGVGAGSGGGGGEVGEPGSPSMWEQVKSKVFMRGAVDLPKISPTGGLWGGLDKVAEDRRQQSAPPPGTTAQIPGVGALTTAGTPEGQLAASQALELGQLPMPGQRGVPLLPEGLPDEGFATQNQSFEWGKPTLPQTGVRYFDTDLLEPYKWSREDRAEVQRILQKIGLYGDDTVNLGSWGPKDIAVYAELLMNANIEGRTWRDQLQQWTIQPPQDILDALKPEPVQKPTIQVSNPADIAAGVQDTAAGLLGTGIPTADAEAIAPQYQQLEAQSQRAVYRDQDQGGGGTVQAPPSVATFAENKIREQRPLEVDTYSFMNQFNEFLKMLGGPIG